MLQYPEDKLIGITTFVAATFVSKGYHFNMHDIYDTLIKGGINFIFALCVVVLSHYIKRYLNKSKHKINKQ